MSQGQLPQHEYDREKHSPENMSLDNQQQLQTDEVVITPTIEEPVTNLVASPERMGLEIQSEGQELQEVLRLFKESTAWPISDAILSTPLHKLKALIVRKEQVEEVAEKHIVKQRKSPRLKGRLSSGKPVIKMAKELVAKECGVIKENQKLDSMTLQQYINLYRCPLTKGSVQVIMKLTEEANKRKKKARKRRKQSVHKAKTKPRRIRKRKRR